MSFIYVLSRDSRGKLSALTEERLDQDRRALRLETWKTTRGIQSTAMGIQYSEDGTMYQHAVGLAGGGDYWKRVAVVPGRATEKAIRAAHERALESLPSLLNEARAHYNLPSSV